MDPMESLPEAPAPPRQKVCVRERYKSHGWATPPGNQVAVYLEACERHRVPANSAVIAQLQRRVRLTQSGPWQRVSPPELMHPGPITTTFAAASSTTAAGAGGRAASPTASLGAAGPTAPATQTSGTLGLGPSYSLSYSQSQVSQPSYSQSQILSPISSHMAVGAASVAASELRELILAHVHPLTLSPSLIQTGVLAGSGQQQGTLIEPTGPAAGGTLSGGASRSATTGGARSVGFSAGGGGGSLASLGGSRGGSPMPGQPPQQQHSHLSQNHSETVSAAALVLATGGPHGPLYSARAVERVCRLVDPRTPWEQQLAVSGLSAATRVFTEADFQRLLEAAAATASLGELRQAALEVLSRPVGYGTLDVEGLVGALFDYLDVSAEGAIPASELRSAVSTFCPVAASDMYGMIERFPPMGRAGSEPVTRDEFVEILSALAPSLSPASSPPTLVRDKAEIVINAMLDNKIREPYGYDFSRCYLGPRGLLPVLDALGCDGSFTHLSLANCGLGCSSVEKLVDWLQGHPNLTSLDLTNNLIADRGGMALTRLLQTNTKIVELGIGSTYLLPPRPSRTHHDSLGPSPCEDARPLLEALAANRTARRSAPVEIVRALRQHGPELRAMFYSLLAREAQGGRGSSEGPGRRPGSAPSDGRVPLTALREALGEVTAEWGFTADALDEVLHHERLLGTSTAQRTADDSGRLGVTYDELMQFLRSEDQVLRVAQAFRNHLVETKQLFFSLALEPATAASMSPVGVSGPRAALSVVRQAVLAAASLPGSGWDVSEEDLTAVLSPAFLRGNYRAPPTGNSRVPGAAATAAVVTTSAPGPGGLLMAEWAAVRVAAVAASASGQSPSGRSPSAQSMASSGAVMSGRAQNGGGAGARTGHSSSSGGAGGEDMLISWPELCNTMLYLFNR